MSVDKGPPTTASFNDLYEGKYAGDYMDKDAYSVWGHGDLRTAQVLDTLRLVPGQPARILDYGCGVGGWMNTLSSAFPAAHISGVDVSAIAIEKARSKFPSWRFESFDGLVAPFDDDSFDLIFSYHVLEHVFDFEASARDIARMLAPGGHAVIIFPCGNRGSFLDNTVMLLKDGARMTSEGRRVLSFEMPDGHVRRVDSDDAIATFTRHGLQARAACFSGHYFGTIDWLCRGTSVNYINRVFAGEPVSAFARMRIALRRQTLLALHRLVDKRKLDTRKKRNPLKQLAVHAIRQLALLVDRLICLLSGLEWRYRRFRTNGSAQYLVLQKS